MKIGIFGKKTLKTNDKDNAKIKMVEVSQLRFDRDFKNVFQQENDKVAEIANDMRANAFDKSRPIIVTELLSLLMDIHVLWRQRKPDLRKYLL